MSDPTPHEVRQAALLAHGLQQGVGHDWSKTDPEVREAIYALRPELAPPPREGLLEEALAEVLEGPLAAAPNEEELREARAFADALDRGAPPSEADLEAAVYALQPERAPAPTLTLDDILDGVSTGPFAPVIRITGEFPAEIAPPMARSKASPTPDSREPSAAAPVVSLSDHRARQESQSAPGRPGRPAWFLPVVGTLAAAAATFLVVLPSVSMNESAPAPALAGAPAPRTVAAPAASVVEEAAEFEEEPRSEAVQKRKKSPSAAPAASGGASPAPPPPPADAGLDDARAPSAAPASPAPRQNHDARSRSAPGGGKATAKKEATATASEGRAEDRTESLGIQSIRTESRSAGEGSISSRGVGDSANTGAFAEGDLSMADEAIRNTYETALLEAAPAREPEPSPPVEEAPDRADVDGWSSAEDLPMADASPPPGEVLAEAVRTGEVTATSSARPRRPARKGNAAPAAASADAPPSNDLGLIDTRLAAAHPHLRARWQAAHDLQRRGDLVGAARALWSIAQTESSPEVVVDAAVRSGQLHLMVDDIEAATRSLDRARRFSPQNPKLLAARDALADEIAVQNSRNSDRIPVK